MILFEPLESGGLEEYAVTLAIGLQQRGQQVSVLTTTWTPSGNQYMRRLRENKVTVVQPPKWLSRLVSHWPTKERILSKSMWLASPLVYLLASGLFIHKRRTWPQAITSTHGWLSGQLLVRFIGPDRRELLGRLLLNWWRVRWHPDLIHIQGYTKTLLFAVEWAHAHEIPIVYEEHQTPDAQFDWWQGFQQTINKATTVVAVSEKSAQALQEICGVTRPIVVRSPLLPDPLAEGWRKNGSHPQDDKPFRITTVARLSVAKGLTYLLDTIAIVKATYPETQFQVYGDGELRQELLDYAGTLDLDGETIFVGSFTSREELDHIMAETDIFVMSSILEGKPLGVVEAMAYGCPIVATAVGGVPELIEDGVNGLLCAPKDPACLAQKIRHLLADPELRGKLGRAARHSYRQGPYQPASVCDHFISIYQKTIQQDRSKKQEDTALAQSLGS